MNYLCGPFVHTQCQERPLMDNAKEDKNESCIGWESVDRFSFTVLRDMPVSLRSQVHPNFQRRIQ